MSIKKGDKVKCVSCWDGEFTVGNEYEVLAVAGDKDTATSGYVNQGGFILACDSGQHCYCLVPPLPCLFGEWELVND